jgi:dTDP-4-amino-4,6-dideoxygalactose transaminase
MTNPVLQSYQAHKEEINTAIQRVLETGNYILGNKVQEFEEEFSQYIGTKYGVGVANGTDAITLALMACGVGKGDEVITVSHTAVATVTAIERAGATPILVDINPHTYTMDPECFWKALTPKTKAVIPVHLYGHPADMDSIVNIAHGNRVLVIEDCAQSHGAMIGNKKTGTFGDIAAFSFYPTKNLGAIGDGGMVVTDNEELAELVRCLRQYGWIERSISSTSGMNSRLDEIQAAILRVKLKYLDKDNLRRRTVADIYNKALKETPLKLPEQAIGTHHVYHQYVVRAFDRDALRQYLDNCGFQTAIHYPVPVHMQPAYRTDKPLPLTERICKEIISLPISPYSEETSKEISALIAEYFDEG